MQASNRSRPRKNSAPGPLNKVRLEEMALAYVARFSTSAARFEAYLARKLRERGWDDGTGDPPDPAVIARRFVELGYIDDEAYARAKSGSLLRRGYGRRRVDQALHASGIGEDLRAEMVASEAQQRKAALLLARKRGFGPFGSQPIEREKREKQLTAMLRAGHPLDSARQMVDALSIDEAEAWVAEAEEEM